MIHGVSMLKHRTWLGWIGRLRQGHYCSLTSDLGKDLNPLLTSGEDVEAGLGLDSQTGEAWDTGQ